MCLELHVYTCGPYTPPLVSPPHGLQGCRALQDYPRRHVLTAQSQPSASWCLQSGQIFVHQQHPALPGSHPIHCLFLQELHPSARVDKHSPSVRLYYHASNSWSDVCMAEQSTIFSVLPSLGGREEEKTLLIQALQLDG